MKQNPSCEKFQSLLWDYATQSLPQPETEKLSLHLSTCTACQQTLAECEQIVRATAQIKQASLPTSQAHWEELEIGRAHV